MLYLSPQFEKITGYLAADFIHNKKRTFNDSIIKEFQPEIFKQWEKAIAEKSFFEAEYPIQSNDNQIKWIWERGTGVFDDRGNVLFLEGYIEDITQRKQNEAILRESEERFSIAFKASPAPLVISEIETGLFIDVNNRWVEMLGFSREEQIGKTSKEVGIWRNPPERDRIIQKVLKKGFFKDEYIEFKTKTGETIMHSGKKLMLSMIHDITARVKAENELLRLKENLEVEVEEKTRELRERIAELERFQQATIDREFRIKELRDEIQLLKNKTIDTNHDTS
jgi:PAS domain S-box-containing protein